MELLVVIAIIGVLVALLLPAVQAARESARRATCQNNVKQLLLGMQLFHDANRAFPGGIELGYHPTAASNHMHSWVPWILPYIEQQALHKQYRFDRPWSDPTTNSYITRRPDTVQELSMLLCPTTPVEIKGRLDYGAIPGPGSYRDKAGVSYAEDWWNGAAWSLGVMVAIPGNAGNTTATPNKRIKISQITDGTTKSVMLGECAGRDVNDPNPPPNVTLYWANGDHAYAHHGAAVNVTPVDELYSDHPTGLHLGMADASVRFITEATPKNIIDAVSTRAGEEIEHGEDG